MSSLGGVFRSYLEGVREGDDRAHRATCPHCKKVLRESDPVDVEEVAALVGKLVGSTNDGSYEAWEALSGAGWSIGLAGLLEVDPGLKSLRDAILLDENGDVQVAKAGFTEAELEAR